MFPANIGKRGRAPEIGTPYVIDYTMVDSDADGKVSAEEFKKGCAAGAVKAGDDATVKDMEGN
ncbi:MAG: hypothetical protein WBB88_08500 [Methyloceanibacter sp.]|jgi:hypothetical protein